MRVMMCLVLAAGVANAAEPPSIYESHDLADTTEGDLDIQVAPDDAYRAATDYAHWPSLFPDMRKAIVTRGDPSEARVTFVYDDGTSDHIHFHNRPVTRTLWFEEHEHHVDAWAEITFLPTATPGATHVHARLHAAVHGWASMFASGDDVRAKRQQRLLARLVGLQALSR